MLTFFEVSLQVHGEQWGAGGVVGTADWPVVTTGLMFSADVITVIWGEEQRIINVLLLYSLSNGISTPSLWALLSCRQFDGERAAQWVHLKCSRFPSHCGGGGGSSARTTGCGPAAIFTVNEQLSDLLGYRNVVHHNS